MTAEPKMIHAITIPPELRAEVYAHARAAYPAECCGYLVGAAGDEHVTHAITCRNAQRDGEHPTHPERGEECGFVIGGADLLAFARSFASELPARVVYHSHTNGRAYFSSVDRMNAVVPTGRSESGPLHLGPAGRGESGPLHLGPAGRRPEGPTYPVQHLVIGVTAQGVTEAAQFAWSSQAHDFVEVARWKVEC